MACDRQAAAVRKVVASEYAKNKYAADELLEFSWASPF